MDAWKKGGADTRYGEIAGANHFNVVDPLGDPKAPWWAGWSNWRKNLVAPIGAAGRERALLCPLPLRERATLAGQQILMGEGWR